MQKITSSAKRSVVRTSNLIAACSRRAIWCCCGSRAAAKGHVSRGAGAILSATAAVSASRALSTTSSTYQGISGPKRKFVVSGASGMLGTELGTMCSRDGIEIVKLVRKHSSKPDEAFWDPLSGKIETEKLEGADAFIHLAGENIGSGDGLLAFTGRWTEDKKKRILRSRQLGTKLLAETAAGLKHPPKAFVSASGVGYYGDSGDTVLTEDSPKGDGFLADVASEWELATKPASDAGIRTVNARLGVVLSKEAGALEKLYLPFFLGLGGPIGTGEQWFSWISLRDAARALRFLAVGEGASHGGAPAAGAAGNDKGSEGEGEGKGEGKAKGGDDAADGAWEQKASGPVNVCSTSCRQSEFATALGSAMTRPAIIPLPSFAVKLMFGEMGDETILVSLRGDNSKLTKELGFKLLDETPLDGCKYALQ